MLRLRGGSNHLHNHRLARAIHVEREFMVARCRYIPLDGWGMAASQRGLDDYSLPTRLRMLRPFSAHSASAQQ